jgi:predicted phosphodiesterase
MSPGARRAACLVAWAALASCAAMAEEADRLAITHGPALVSPRGDGVTVVWHTSRRCVSHVEYGAGEALDRKAVSAHHGLIDADVTLHNVRLSGLEPGKSYRYRVVSREIVKLGAYKVDYGATVESEPSSFRVLDPAKEAFSFVAVSDIHEKAARLDGMLQSVAWKGVDLVFLNGDILSHFDREGQVGAGFLDVCVSRFAKTIPYIHVRGNHETRGPAARQLMGYAPTPEGRFYYAFDHGGVHFVVLDSGEDKPDADKEYFGLAAFDPYRREQAEWLKGEIRSDGWRKAAFRVAVFHMPPFGGNNWHGETQIREIWNPLLNEGGVDLVLSGHTHQFAHLPPAADANRYPIVIGSPESVTRVDVAGKGMQVRATGAEGKELASFRLEAR